MKWGDNSGAGEDKAGGRNLAQQAMADYCFPHRHFTAKSKFEEKNIAGYEEILGAGLFLRCLGWTLGFSQMAFVSFSSRWRTND
jgi:hypothetical protein